MSAESEAPARTALAGDRTAALAPAMGDAMHALLRKLYPLTRSLTGTGLRATVAALGDVVPLIVTEVASGSQVFDWTVPDEWTIEDAYLEDAQGRRILDFRASNLHVVGYSTPIDATLSLAELQPHLHSLPDQPDLIPFRTSYYAPSWGFCLADRVRQTLVDGQYRAVIRSRLAPGSLTLAEHLHAGDSSDEVLIFAHDCHPSLANDNLSGVVVATSLAAFLRERQTRYSYRFVFAPATIGSITWLSQNQARLHRIKHGMVLSLLGGGGPFHYKKSRNGSALIDRAAWHVLQHEAPNAKRLEFIPWGYDERQFCSPGINLPIGRLTRTPNGEFPEYHTSADNPDFISAAELGEAWLICLRIVDVLERDRRYVNLAPFGEAQLGRRGLYRTTGGHQDVPERQLALLWILNQSDGISSLLDIAERSRLPFSLLANAANDLEAAGLLRVVSSDEPVHTPATTA
jgi:aminopeptidase-like protein